MQVNSECYPIYSDAAKLDECWKNASQSLGIDPAGIEECAYGSEGISMLKDDEQLTSKNRVTGSPTLIINDVRYSGARSPEAFKQAICDAFISPPASCAVNLSSTQPSASGQC
ncbi:MAG: DsbA family protein [Methanomicrobiales archaeon]|nr:DsbA family protein [Methanomicrobiales archaeon]